VPDDPDGQQQAEPQRGDNKHDNHRQREGEILLNDTPCVPAQSERIK
jgi:hypothetical protein